MSTPRDPPQPKTSKWIRLKAPYGEGGGDVVCNQIIESYKKNGKGREKMRRCKR